MVLKYQNISISGGVACGKGTLKDGLRQYLEPLGWKFASGGELNRRKSGDNLTPSAEKVSVEFNNSIEKRTEDLFIKEKNYVIEAWLAGWVARNMTDTLRIFMYCSNDAVRVDRVSNRDHVDIQTAKEIIRDRELANFSEWKRIYGDHNFWDPNIYQLKIDTYSLGKTQAVQAALEALGFQK
ncbi:MAG: cytidylate kinase family protein [Patescibacteria group bacterium]